MDTPNESGIFASVGFSINAEIIVSTSHDTYVSIPADIRGSKTTVHRIEQVFLDSEGTYEFTVVLDDGSPLKLKTSNCNVIQAGTSANIAIGLRRLGYPVFLCGVVADGHYGRLIKSSIIRESGIESLFLPRPATALTLVVVDKDSGETTLLCHKPPYEIDIKDAIKNLSLIHPKYQIASGVRETELPLVASLFREDGGSIKIFNPNITLFKDLHPSLKDDLETALGLCDILFINEDEAMALLKKTSFDPHTGPHELLKRICRDEEKIPSKIVIITRGHHGAASVCYINDEPDIIEERASPVDKVVDTAGAGDAFLVGFIHAHHLGLSHRKMVKAGCHTAAWNIRAVGGHGGMPTKSQLEEYIHSL